MAVKNVELIALACELNDDDGKEIETTKMRLVDAYFSVFRKL